MATTNLAIGLVILSSILGAIGGFVFKLSSNSLKLQLKSLVKNYNLLLGFLFFALAALVYIYSLTQGELSVLYPISSLTYMWSIIIANFYLKEEINKFKIVGIIFILLGTVLIVN